MAPFAAPSIALLAVLLFSVPVQETPAPKPNILFIYADDQSYKTLGCYPEAPRWDRTPNVDRRAAAGLR